jgi:hypothetical protein
VRSASQESKSGLTGWDPPDSARLWMRTRVTLIDPSCPPTPRALARSVSGSHWLRWLTERAHIAWTVWRYGFACHRSHHLYLACAVPARSWSRRRQQHVASLTPRPHRGNQRRGGQYNDGVISFKTGPTGLRADLTCSFAFYLPTSSPCTKKDDASSV